MKTLKNVLHTFIIIFIIIGAIVAIGYGLNWYNTQLAIILGTAGKIIDTIIIALVVDILLATIGWMLANTKSSPFENTFLPRGSFLSYFATTTIAIFSLGTIGGALAGQTWLINKITNSFWQGVAQIGLFAEMLTIVLITIYLIVKDTDEQN